MLNQIVLVGRLTKEPELIETESGKTYSNITLAVPRPYKNAEGIYDTDFINCSIWNNVAINTSEYCKKGDLIGIKGRVQSNLYDDKETGENKFKMEIVAEKVTFLTSKSHNEPENERY